MENEKWYPNPKQIEALQTNAFETLYGGARGGGKTDAGIVWLLKEIKNPRLRALVIRRNADDLSDWLDRARRMYQRYGAVFTGQPATVKFPSGAIIRAGHLKDDQAYTKYQGHEYQRMLIEEVTQIPDETRYLQLLGSCRSTVPNLAARVFLTTNPGGVGHQWVKQRFVDVAAPGTKYTDQTGRTRIFIPARVEDTPQLANNDPGYIAFLEGLKDKNPELWKAWRLGDWDTFAGQFFSIFNRRTHVINPFIPLKNALIFGGLDWGRVDNFSFHLTEVERIDLEGTHFFRSRVFCEVYGTEKTVPEWVRIIKEKIKFYNLTLSDISWIRADTQIFNKNIDTAVLDIYTQFVNCDERFRTLLRPANKDRIGGWENLQNWFSIAPDGKPYLQFTSDCINAIRVIPSLIHDENKVEDVDQEGENDAADSIRYLHMALKWIDGAIGAAKQAKALKQEQKIFFADINDEGKQIPVDFSKFKK